jgi:hypothetical protein
MRLLCIDDENPKSVIEAFKNTSVELVVCKNALQALDLMGRENFDFILIELSNSSPYAEEKLGEWITRNLKTPWSLLCDKTAEHTISREADLPNVIAELVAKEEVGA